MVLDDVNKTKDQFIENSCGRGLIAEAKFLHGDTIVSIAEPYAVLPENAVVESHCFHCFKEGQLFRCSGCGVVKYCGNLCQKTSWRLDHKLECHTFKDIKAQGHGILPTTVRAVIRVLRNHKTGLALDPKWARLASHRTRFMEQAERRDNVILQARMALKYANVSTEMMSVAIDILCRIEVNGFHITDPAGTPLGLCFEPILSLANHSCVPNSFISCDGRKISLRALHAIEECDEINIAYIDPNLLLSERRAILEQHYFFVCTCIRCEKNLNVYDCVLYRGAVNEAQLSLIQDVQKSASLAQRLLKENHKSGEFLTADKKATSAVRDLIEPVQRLAELKKTLKKHVWIGDTPLLALAPCPDIVHEIFLTCIQAGLFAVAFVVQTAVVFNIDPFLYPEPWHPSRVASMFALYKLLKIVFFEPEKYGVHTISVFSDNFPSNFNALPALAAILSSIADECAGSFGSMSRFTQQVQEEIKDLERVSSQMGDIEFSKIRGQDLEQRQKYVKQVKDIASPEFVMKVIESVELA